MLTTVTYPEDPDGLVLNGGDQDAYFEDHTIVFWLRAVIISLVSFLIITSNLINLTVLRTTIQIPALSRFCLINLSCADFLVGCVSCAPCVVTSALDRWIYGDVWCQIAGIVHGCSVTVSIWSLALISVDRYVAIVHPLRYHSLMTITKCRLVVGLFWTVSFLTFFFPLTLKTGFIYYEYSVAESMCGLYWDYPWFCVVTAIYIPVLSGAVLGVTNFKIVRIVLAMKKQNKKDGTERQGQRIRGHERSVISDGPCTVGITEVGTTTNRDSVLDTPASQYPNIKEVSVMEANPDHRSSVGRTGAAPEANDLGETTERNREKSRDLKAVKVLAITAVTYFTAWGPYVASVVITSFFSTVALPSWLRFFVMWLANSNSFMNVIIYSVMYSSFRRNAWSLIKTCFLCRCRPTSSNSVEPLF